MKSLKIYVLVVILLGVGFAASAYLLRMESNPVTYAPPEVPKPERVLQTPAQPADPPEDPPENEPVRSMDESVAARFALKPILPNDEPFDYLRVHREADRLDLELAVRKFVADDADPIIYLVGVTHIGEESYYDDLQKFLDAQELVLYEGVGRPPFMDPVTPQDTDETRVSRTRSAIGFVASHLQWYHRTFGSFPENFAWLLANVREYNRQQIKYLRHAVKDAWGNPIVYEVTNGSFTLTSYGADGAAGGEKFSKDIVHEGEAPDEDTVGAGQVQGIQHDLANMLDLKFQLDAIDYDREHWVNSDMPARQMAKILRQTSADNGGGEDEQLSNLMDAMRGEGALYGLLRFVMRIVGSSPRAQGYIKAAMVEMLGTIGDKFHELPQLPEAQKRLMKILVEDRNQVVMDDVKRILEGDDVPATIAIFYGAAHLRDLELRLRDQLEYKPVAEFWLSAFGVNLKEAGVDEDQLAALRAMIRAQLKLPPPSEEDQSNSESEISDEKTPVPVGD